jgi:hypothetical protein
MFLTRTDGSNEWIELRGGTNHFSAGGLGMGDIKANLPARPCPMQRMGHGRRAKLDYG